MKYVDPDGLVFRTCDNNGNCIEFSDEYINNTLRNKKLNPDIRLKDGKIFQGKEQIGTFTRPSFDDLPSGANQLVNEMAARAPAMNQAIAGFAVGTAVVGATGGVAAYYVGPLGTMLVGSAPETISITSPYVGLSNAALNQLIGAAQRELLKDFLGQGVEGALARLSSFRIPLGLTRQALEIYREVAVRAIQGGKDIAGTQAVILKLIEKALEALK